jgi:hypothetical protein
MNPLAVTQKAGLPSGSKFPIGDTIITFSASDGDGTITFITIEDTEDLVAVCQNITVQLDGTVNATITKANIDNGSTDNCMFTLSLDTTAFTCANIGKNTVATVKSPVAGTLLAAGTTTTVTFTVKDAALNSTPCSFDVTVDTVAGITDNAFTASKVVLYPNPSSDNIFIKTNNVPLINASIYDIRGRVLRTLNVYNTQDYKIDISNLEGAQYFLILNSETGTVTKRFVKY